MLKSEKRCNSSATIWLRCKRGKAFRCVTGLKAKLEMPHER